MKTTIVYWGYINCGIRMLVLNSSMLRLHRNNGKELGNYYLGVRARVTAVAFFYKAGERGVVNVARGLGCCILASFVGVV